MLYLKTKNYFLSIVLIFVSNFALCQALDAPDVEFVSVNPYTNAITVQWSVSESADINFTRLHNVFDVTGIVKAKTIEDITGNTTTSFTFKTDDYSIFNKTPEQAPLSFAVDVHAINNDNTTTLSEYHSTMFLTHVYTTCSSTFDLDWTAYVGFNCTIDNYEVYEVDNTNTETLIATTKLQKISVIIPESDNSERRFFVKAYFTNKQNQEFTSTSNMVSINIPYQKPPTILRSETVITVNENTEVSWTLDNENECTNFAIYELNEESKLEIIDTISIPLQSKKVSYSFANNSNKKQYKITALNNCYKAVYTSDTVQPAYIKVTEKTISEHTVEITPALVYPQINSCIIYTILSNNKEQLEQLFEIPETYVHTLSNEYSTNPNFCYQIDFLQNSDVIVQSNITCIRKEASIFYPNAFDPLSSQIENRVFKPRYAFIDGTYSLKIYSISGALLFESNSIELGWDGKVNQKFVPQGTYMFYAHIVLSNGEEIIKKGELNLISE